MTDQSVKWAIVEILGDLVRAQHQPEDYPDRNETLGDLADQIIATVKRICLDCGEPTALFWEDGVRLCNDCAILRAKRSQMERERGG